MPIQTKIINITFAYNDDVLGVTQTKISDIRNKNHKS